MMMAGIYRFLITDFLNPLALPRDTPGSGGIFIYAQSLLQACIVILMQWFFCWRIWAFSASSFSMKSRVAFTALTVSLSIFSFGRQAISVRSASQTEAFDQAQSLLTAAATDLAINGFTHKILTGNTPGFTLAFKLATSSQITYDVIVTAAMTWSLQRARMGIKRHCAIRPCRKDHVIQIITLFMINTNLLTTLLAIAGLVTFLTLPNATVYGGIEFLLGKTCFNSFFAVLNARDYMREKFDSDGSTSAVYPEFRDDEYRGETGDTLSGPYELASLPDMTFCSVKAKATITRG
ncbi:hypothetical protein D9613_010634 [Agrocybe pediades]|uniref:DUF6534 domain-containing protein n=1 Tax=Agrocybe pediades TaxID=84607 RepID=A0A8H4QFS7_9AGAR|nr:hypothetical protein D9613_010634 [Agrocybe pediades]